EQAFQFPVRQFEIAIDPRPAAAKEARDITCKQAYIAQPLRRKNEPLAEQECLFWIAEGKTSDEIAMILGISRNTI
ncbi:LuxR C-terminal-related transcriptional regulator, partial [Rhizobium leguminosarum]|uniref:LuxR C-terminal-related transcriptional regulator n=1 Tax=Rhizobium leguminosarum TaxID=384 RepID=UPI003F9B0E7E